MKKIRLWKQILQACQNEWMFFAGAAIFGILPLFLVIFGHGWPQNHEYLQFFDRTYVWADHFRQGDFLPIWSSSDAGGYGTPLPLYYQKLFHVVNAVFFIVFSNIKVATIATLFLFSMIGIYGLRAAMKFVSTNKSVVNILPLVLPITGYAITLWFVRGAMAELTAFAILPWLLWWCLRLIKINKISYWIILIFPALFYAHNAIALVSLIFIGITVIAVLTNTVKCKELFISSWKKALICFVSIVALIAPILGLQAMMNKDYNPTDKIDDIQNLDVGFKPPLDYLFDRNYVWLHSSSGLSVQVDILLWVSIIVLVIVGLLVWWMRNGRRKLSNDRAMWVVIVSLLLYGALQLEVTRPIYEMIHVLSLIQFPWRMLTVITPLLILVVGLSLDKLWPKMMKRSVLSILLALWLVLYLAFSPLTYPNEVKRLNIRSDYPTEPLYASGEYLPITYTKAGELIDNVGMMKLYREMAPDPDIQETSQVREGTVKTFTVNLKEGRNVALPISYSRYATVYVNGKEVETFRDIHDPRLLIDLGTGISEVKVILPTTMQFFKYVFN